MKSFGNRACMLKPGMDLTMRVGVGQVGGPRIEGEAVGRPGRYDGSFSFVCLFVLFLSLGG
jgi:hypothetical protein